VAKLADSVQQMRQPIRAIETFLSLVDVNLLQCDQSVASNGVSLISLLAFSVVLHYTAHYCNAAMSIGYNML